MVPISVFSNNLNRRDLSLSAYRDSYGYYSVGGWLRVSCWEAAPVWEESVFLTNWSWMSYWSCEAALRFCSRRCRCGCGYWKLWIVSVFRSDYWGVGTQSRIHFFGVDSDSILSVDSKISFFFYIVLWVITVHCFGWASTHWATCLQSYFVLLSDY